MYTHGENTVTSKLSELIHLSSLRKTNQRRFYEVVVSENR